MTKVLIIEDDPPYRNVYKRKFEISGFEVALATNGEEGLEKMHSFKPKLVLTDLMMPKMDGFQLLTKAKADPALRDIPIVVLTNLSTSNDAYKVMELGAVGVIVKSDTEPAAIVKQAKQILAGAKS